jgi:uncharacterized RDD family membrane protein YckC
MKNRYLLPLAALAIASLFATPPAAIAKTTPPAAAAQPSTAPPAAQSAGPEKPPTLKIEVREDADSDADSDKADDKDGRDNTLVSIGHNSNLAAGEHATAVVSVLGNSTSAGEVDEAVVSVLGNTRVTGRVGENAVAVLGNTYVDSRVGENVVAVLGNVELGPHADVGGNVVAVGGDLVRDPGAIVHGEVQHVALLGHMGGFEWLQSWVHHCLLYGRPLAFAPGLGWAWGVALSFLALYLLIALMFPQGVNRCVQTMEAQPGRTVLAALFTFICKPIVFLLLVITVIGTILIPFLAFALFIGGLFGKAVALTWLGRRALPARESTQEHRPVVALLVGGLIALVLYVVPILGFIAYKALDVLGLGIVVYTLLLGFRAARAAGAGPRAVPPPAAGLAPTPTPAAATQTTADASASAAPAADPSAEPQAGAAAASAAPASPAAPAISIAHANRAGFWIRMAALLLDLILIAIICKIVGFSHGHELLVLAVYGAVMWKLKGTTIGGAVCGLRVVRLDGRAVDWPTAVARALGCFLSLVVAGLGFIWVVFDSERQSWHDKIAGTVVVHVPRGTPLV